jgi:ATP-dependent DNA ligase
MFKPMLASTIKHMNLLRFPLLVSKKFDGLRASMQEGRLVSRTLTDIPNTNVQKMFRGIPDGVDGELIVGDPWLQGCFNRTQSVVMSDDKPAVDLCYYCFDKYSKKPFIDRLADAAFAIHDHEYTCFVEHQVVNSVDEIDVILKPLIEAGWEGLMLRDPYGRYKEGRSSEAEGLLLRIKPFVDFEGEVVGYIEREHNGNVATTDNLGHTKRGSCQANMSGLDDLGALVVVGINGLWKGTTFKCGTGFDAQERKELWKTRNTLIGRIAKMKYQLVGSKDKPRIPVFLGWRDPRDMGE